MNIKGLNFIRTCSASPEQYDVLDSNNNIVGYVRLRWGKLTCEYPDIDGELIYEADIGNGWTGCFESDEQRMEHLNNIADKILKKINVDEQTDECSCLKTDDKDEYWGYWVVCECGFNNIEGAKYCGGCGKKINVVGITEDFLKW